MTVAAGLVTKIHADVDKKTGKPGAAGKGAVPAGKGAAPAAGAKPAGAAAKPKK